MRSSTVLVVDPDDPWRETLHEALRAEHRVLRATSGEAALALLMREDIDVLLLDAEQPGISAFEVLRIARENFELTEIVVTGREADIDTAIEAVRLGAFHYVPKSAGTGAIRGMVARALERRALTRRLQVVAADAAETSEREFVAGPSPAVQEVLRLAQRVAGLDTTVLVLGESGTGKELLARLLHRQGARADGPFVAVNLAAIPQDLVESVLFGHERGAFTGAVRQQIGKFELASGGTLFLDEVGDLRLDLQAKLLRAIQEGEIERIGSPRPIKTDFRLIAATNVDLDRAVREGRFREDLYFRLRVIPIRMPPLRERIEDLPALCALFVKRYSLKFRKQVEGVSERALRALAAYDWPGNIRELENLIERLVAITDRTWITEDDLPVELQVAELDAAPRRGSLFQDAMMVYERNLLIRALDRNGWNVTQTARYLGLPLSTLKFKIDKLGVREAGRRVRT